MAKAMVEGRVHLTHTESKTNMAGRVAVGRQEQQLRTYTLTCKYETERQRPSVRQTD